MSQSKTLINAEASGQRVSFLIGNRALDAIQKLPGAPDGHLKGLVRLEVFWRKNT
jgi:hypothetical protein